MQRRDDFANIVTNKAEASISDIFFHDSTESQMGVFGHCITLVQNDELKLLAEDCTRAGEVLDLIAHDVDATVVRCVKF